MKNWRWESTESMADAFSRSNYDLVRLVAYVQHGSYPCNHFLPEWEKLAKWAQSFARCHLVEMTENPSVGLALGKDVRAVPATDLFRGNQLLHRWEGPYTCEALQQRIRTVMKGVA